METKYLKGSEIKEIRTINSTYADGKVEVYDKDGNYYRMPVEAILEIVQKYNFKMEKKKIYTHLIEPIFRFLK
jgi:hypothetical protein